MKDKRFRLYSISEERGVLLGIATVAVMLFHSYSLHFEEVFSSAQICNILNYLKEIGNIGVDIFLFISAFGLYFSMSKDSDIKHFYKKRVLRIVPSAVIIATIYYLYVGTGSVVDFLKKVFLISFYENNDRDFWFLSFILIMYIMFPLFYKIVEKYDTKGMIVLVGAVLLTNYLIRSFDYELYSRLEIALTRIPVFLIAILIGKKAKNRSEISIWWLLLAVIVFVGTNILLYKVSFEHYYIVRYLYGILAIAFVFVACATNKVIRKYLGGNGTLSRFLTWIGMYSLEIYLIYEKLALEVRRISVIKIDSSVLFYMLILVMTLVLSAVLKNVNARITGKLRV